MRLTFVDDHQPDSDFEQYSITVTEAVDLVKDIFYCYIVNHTNQVLTILLWIFALFAFSYDIVSILILT